MYLATVTLASSTSEALEGPAAETTEQSSGSEGQKPRGTVAKKEEDEMTLTLTRNYELESITWGKKKPPPAMRVPSPSSTLQLLLISDLTAIS